MTEGNGAPWRVEPLKNYEIILGVTPEGEAAGPDNPLGEQ